MARLLSAMQSLAPQTPEEADALYTRPEAVDPVQEFSMDRRKEKAATKEEKDAIELREFIDSTTPDDVILDNLFDELGDDDEDEELRANLVSLGRKYNTSGTGAKEESDIEARFAPQISKLNQLGNAVDASSKAVDNDLNQIRMARSRNSKALADLVSARSSLFSTRLSIIKEQNNIQKMIVDLKLKMRDKNEAVEANAAATQAAVQEVLNSGLISYDADIDDPGSENTGSGAVPHKVEDTMSDEERVKSIFGDEKQPGDDYIKYENEGIQLHMRMGKDGSNKRIVAIDKYGQEVPDYPIPEGDLEEAGVSVFDDIGIARDAYSREYILDYDDE